MSMSFTSPLLAGVPYFGGRTEKGLMRFRANTNVWSGRDVRTGRRVDISKRPSQEGLALQHSSVMKFEDSTDNEVTPPRGVESGVDTAWVALVENIDQRGQPQYPAAIEWIAENQLEDGSWGDSGYFSSYDWILCTLACVVALTSCKICSDKCRKGITFLKENISRLEYEDEAHMPVGFEITLPSLMEIARGLEIEIPFVHPALQEIYLWREIKLSRIPNDLLHEVPTTLLFSLEGMKMKGLNWDKILRLQCYDGSFLASPSSNAFALMQTKDRRCLNYLNDVVQRFNGGVPHAYSVEVFKRLWVTDRLQRLGISRYFREKLEEFMAYVSRLWTNNELSWTRNAMVCDICWKMCP